MVAIQKLYQNFEKKSEHWFDMYLLLYKFQIKTQPFTATIFICVAPCLAEFQTDVVKTKTFIIFLDCSLYVGSTVAHTGVVRTGPVLPSPVCTWWFIPIYKWLICRLVHRLVHLGSTFTPKASVTFCFMSRKTTATLLSISLKTVTILCHFASLFQSVSRLFSSPS